MWILGRHIAKTVISGYLMVLFLLLILFSFISLMDELQDVGDGGYGILDALRYVLMIMPELALNLAPITALLGSLVALATLARNSELIAMQAAGVSVARIGWSVMIPAIGFMLISLLMLQFVAPAFYQDAVQQRTVAVGKLGGGEVLRGKGFWAGEKDRFINVRRLLMAQIPADIDIYEFESDGRLRQYLHAERADSTDDGNWRLVDVERTTMEGRKLISERLPDMVWRPFWDHDPLQMHPYPVASLSLTELQQYIRYLQDVGQVSLGAELTYWRKWFRPLSIGVMALLSVSFVFGSQRSHSFGRRIAFGIMIGVLFFLGSQLIYNLGLVLELSPPLVAFTPVLIVGLAAVLLLWRMSSLG